MATKLRALGSAALAVWMLAACATSPQVGVRQSYQESRLEATSVVPFFTRSTFSLPEATLRTRLRWAESTVVQWLEQHGVEVVPPETTRRRLQAGSAWAPFAEEGRMRTDLGRAFEDARVDHRARSQAELVRRLRRDDRLESRYLLFGEFLYHTTGTCRTRADEYTDRAHVVLAPEAPPSLPRPCITTHFQARLVDADSGETVWYNRQLRELHVPELDASWIRKNLRGVVHETLAGRDGLVEMLE